jgi:MFS family permease
MSSSILYPVTTANIAPRIIVQSVFWPQMTIELNMSFAQLNAGLACNVAGLAAGSLLVIPFTLKYGRRPTYVLSTAIMAAISWWSSRLQTLAEMYITNLLFGLGASVNETIAQLTVCCLSYLPNSCSTQALTCTRRLPTFSLFINVAR